MHRCMPVQARHTHTKNTTAKTCATHSQDIPTNIHSTVGTSLTIFDSDNPAVALPHFGTDDCKFFREIAVEALVGTIIRKSIGHLVMVRERVYRSPHKRDC